MAKVIYNAIMFIVNLVFLLAGATVLAFGIILLTSPGYLQNALESLTGYQNINYLIDINSLLAASGALLAAVGSVIMAVSLLGLCTCCCGGSALYAIYSIFLGLLIAFEITVIIYQSVNYNDVQTSVQKFMYSALVKNFSPVQISGTTISNSTEPGGAAWETLQFTHGCCGAYGYKDFQTFSWQTGFANPSAITPPSCCIQNTQYQWPTSTNDLVSYTGCILGSGTTQQEYVNTKGCYIVAMGVVNKYGYITNIVIASLIALEIIILQMTLHQCYSAKEDKRVFA